MPEAAIYTRISKDSTGTRAGVTRQEKECRDLADRIGVTVAEVFSDNDISGWSGKKRPGYGALLDAIRAGRVSTVIAWHQDRLTRSMIDLEAYAELAISHGVRTVFCQQGEVDMSTPSGLMTARIIGAVARNESDQKQARIRAQKRQAAEQGRWRGGPRPYGYEADGTTVRADEANLIREAHRRVLAGESIRSVWRDWRDRDVRTSTGRPWPNPTAVRLMLARPRNAGLMEVDGQPAGPAQWPAIVPEADWRAVRALLESRRRGRSDGRKHLGSGLYLCACGTPVISSGSAQKRPVYRCLAETPGRHATRTREPVDELVRMVIAERLRSDKKLIGKLASARVSADTVNEAEAEAEVLRGRLDGLTALYAAGDIDAAQLAEGSKDLRARIATAEAKVAAAVSGSPAGAVVSAVDPGAAFLNGPLDLQRAVLDLLATITLLPAEPGRPKGWQPGEPYFDPESVQIVWRWA